jgi:hypothetical protein
VADTTVTLVGGPCDGESKGITQATLSAGRLTCQGTLYVRSNAFPTEENIVFATTDAIGKATGSKAPAHVTTAWTRWMRALAHSGPKAHNRIQRATVRARRIARKR